MDDLKASKVLIQIKDGLTKKKMSHRALFDLCDLNRDNMVSCAEFVQGLKQVVSLAQPVAEQVYALMDRAGNKLVSFD